MKKKIPFLFLLATAIVVIQQSCADHKLAPMSEIDCDGFKQVSFGLDIEPIINSNCAIVGDGGCHNGGNGPDLDWRVFSNFQSHADEVERRVQLPSKHEDHMPRIGSITDAQIKLLVCWVRQGAQDN
jgi:hypothetical protein